MEMKCCFAVICILLMKIQLSYSDEVGKLVGTFKVDPITSTKEEKCLDVYDLLNWNKASGDLTAADLEPFENKLFTKALARAGCDLDRVKSRHLKDYSSMTKQLFNSCCTSTRAVCLGSYCKYYKYYNRRGKPGTPMFDQAVLESAFGLEKEVTQSLFQDGKKEITVQELRKFFKSKKLPSPQKPSIPQMLRSAFCCN